MRHLKFRHIAAAGTLAVIATIPLSACGDPSVSPRPAQAAENETSVAPRQIPSSAPSAPARAQNPEPGVIQPPGQRPVKTRTIKPVPTTSHTSRPTSTKPTGTCYGAVRHDLDLRNTVLDLVTS